MVGTGLTRRLGKKRSDHWHQFLCEIRFGDEAIRTSFLRRFAILEDLLMFDHYSRAPFTHGKKKRETLCLNPPCNAAEQAAIRSSARVSLWTPNSRRLSRLADAEHRDPWCSVECIGTDRKAQYRKLGIFRDGEKALCQAHNPPLLLEIPLSRTTCQDSAI